MNILNQNSKFTIGDDSEIGNLLNWNRKFICENIHHFQLPHEKVADCFLEFCRGGVTSWINQISTNENIFVDKSRHWTYDLDFTFSVFPSAKILILVRDLRGVINSFQKIYNNSLYVKKEDFIYDLNCDLEIRRTQEFFEFQYLKMPLFNIKKIIDSTPKYFNQILFCRYEDLVYNPKKEIEKIYNFLNIDKFEHDFNNVVQKSYYDNPYQPWGIHKIQNEIKFENINSLDYIKQSTKDYILQHNFWYYKHFYPDILMEEQFGL